MKKEKGIFIREEELDVLGIAWALIVLVRLKGADFSLDREKLKTRLKGTTIKGVPAEEIIKKMKFPVKSPAEVLRQIRELTK